MEFPVKPMLSNKINAPTSAGYTTPLLLFSKEECMLTSRSQTASPPIRSSPSAVSCVSPTHALSSPVHAAQPLAPT